MKMITVKNKTKTKFDSVDGKPNVQVDIDVVIGNYDLTVCFQNEENGTMSVFDIHANHMIAEKRSPYMDGKAPCYSFVPYEIFDFFSNLIDWDLDQETIGQLYHESPFKLTGRDQIKDLKKELLALVPVFKEEFPELCEL